MRLHTLAAALLVLAASPALAATARLEVAITVDDLPANSTQRDLAVHAEITDKLVRGFVKHRIPAIGFVNERKLEDDGQLKPQRVALLERWLDAGLELGNHSYSHPSLFRTPLDEVQVDVLRGEKVTRPLLEARGKTLTYFRHPYLNTGPDLETKTAFETFLGQHGYRVAPVTIDNSEWIYARAYDRMVDRGDTEASQRIVDAYLTHMEAMFAYCEQQSEALLGYQVKQTLLLHANRLNADHLDRLVAMIKGRGYRFISLDEALKDKAYDRADRYTGRSGITWLHRWALTEGKSEAFFGQEPQAPAFVMEASGIEQ
ncbi:MAG: polysaccharide deacetylase family protein [Acidobacteriota bacterium]